MFDQYGDKITTVASTATKLHIISTEMIVQSTRPSEGANLEQITIETGPMQSFAQGYAEYLTKSLVCSVGWNHVKFWHS